MLHCVRNDGMRQFGMYPTHPESIRFSSKIQVNLTEILKDCLKLSLKQRMMQRKV